MMEVVVTTGAIKRIQLQSNRHHQQINIAFYRPDALPVARPSVRAQNEREMQINTSCDFLLSLSTRYSSC